MPNSAASGRCSVSIARSTSEYSSCIAVIGGPPSIAAFVAYHAGTSLSPTARIMPARTRSSKAATTSSAGVNPSHTCSQYRSTWSTRRRRSDRSSDAIMFLRPLLRPRTSRTGSPSTNRGPEYFVASTSSSRSGTSRRNSPTSSSLRPSL